MMDTRTPEWSGWVAAGCDNLTFSTWTSDVDVISLTYFMNLEYAKHHGYDLLFYQGSHGGCSDSHCLAACRHERWGKRHASYCKLVGLAEALDAGYEWVVYLDSDAFVANTTLSLPALLRAYGADPAAADGMPAAREEAFFGWDWPYTLGPNMGFIVLRNTPQMRQMVATWWNLHPGAYSMEHPFEQHAMQWQLTHLEAYRQRLQTLTLRTMDPVMMRWDSTFAR
jgi:hypothetical protein